MTVALMEGPEEKNAVTYNSAISACEEPEDWHVYLSLSISSALILSIDVTIYVHVCMYIHARPCF